MTPVQLKGASGRGFNDIGCSEMRGVLRASGLAQDLSAVGFVDPCRRGRRVRRHGAEGR